MDNVVSVQMLLTDKNDYDECNKVHIKKQCDINVVSHHYFVIGVRQTFSKRIAKSELRIMGCAHRREGRIFLHRNKGLACS